MFCKKDSRISPHMKQQNSEDFEVLRFQMSFPLARFILKKFESSLNGLQKG